MSQPTAETYLQLEALVNANAERDVDTAAAILRDAGVQPGDLARLLVAAVASLTGTTRIIAADDLRLTHRDVVSEMTDASLRRLLAVDQPERTEDR